MRSYRLFGVGRFFAPVFLLLPFVVPAQETQPENLPLLTMEDLVYEGAFRVPSDPGGFSSMNYSVGPLAFYPAHNSIFIIGHTYEQAMIEFAIPALVDSPLTSSLNMAGPPLTPFTTVLDRPSGGAPENIDMIGGMAVIGSEILINAFEYYDAPGNNTVSTLVFRDASNIGSCQVDGYFRYANAPPAHQSGWISPIPPEWQEKLGGDFITGHSSGWPIISRLSVGPSAFAFNSSSIIGNSSVPDPVPTVTLLDFDLDNPLASDLYNESGTNDLWTHLSRAAYGLIVPGTRTYLTLGYSGGHHSGVCYKCRGCGGYCAIDPDDYSQYFWLWDLNDLVAVKNGIIPSYSVRPYAYGPFSTPAWPVEFGGGTYDPATGRMYLTLLDADRDQGTYANPPIVIAYTFRNSLCNIVLNPSSYEAPSSGGSSSFTVNIGSGSCPDPSYTARTDTAWVQIVDGESGNATGVVTYAVDPNDTAETRSGFISIDSGAGESAVHQISQAAGDEEPTEPVITEIVSETSRRGAKATIKGTGFDTKIKNVNIYFGTKKAKNISKVSETQITLRIPKLKKGIFEVKVIVEGQTSNTVFFQIR